MKSAIVSGASGNLGAAVVDYFLEQDYRVVGLIHQSRRYDKTDFYRELEVDLLNEELAIKGVEKGIQKFDKIDVGVLCAGGFEMGNIAQTTIERLEYQYKLNFETAYNLARPLLSHMKEQGSGRLFFVGSIPGMDTSKGSSVVAYSLAKSLLFELANMINEECKALDVRAYVIVPSTIDTPQNREAMPNADFSEWQKPEFIAEVIGKYVMEAPKSSTIIISEE